ncbi:MAG: class I SAM-dependent methyltransferase [Pseudomonadota bacterium]
MVDFTNIKIAELETCVCPLCGAGGTESKIYKKDPFKVVCCEECAVWYLSPRLTESRIEQLYLEDSYFESSDGGYEDYSSQEESLRRTFRGLLNRMHTLGMTGGRLLEVGCGYGYFLREAEPYFDSRAGCEMSSGGAERAKHHADEVFIGGIEALRPGLQFDCVVALHVIEHIYHPKEFLLKIMDHLGPGGRLILSAPDMNGFWRKLMGNKWPSFKFPEHVVFYDSSSLGSLMRGVGLMEVEETPYLHAFPMNHILKTLKIPAPQFLAPVNVWLPATTVTVSGRKAASARAAA